MDHLCVVYSTDNNYVQQLGVSLVSLLENNQEIADIKIYILDNEISVVNMEELKQICKRYDRIIKFIPIKNVLNNINLNTDFSISSYARLFMTSFLDEDKILYLDCDTIILSSLKDLEKINMKGYYIAAVQDTVTKELRYAVNVSDQYRYINAGVMYINLKKWREDHIELLFKKCILEHNGNVPHHDQGTLNSVCRGKILFLDPRYNLYDTALFYRAEELIQLFDLPKYYTQSEMETAKKNPVIIHFTPAHYGRPWFRKCNHPFVKEYRKFLKKTMWKEKLIKEPHEVKKNNIRTIKKLLYKWLPFSIYCYLIKKVSEVR